MRNHMRALKHILEHPGGNGAVEPLTALRSLREAAPELNETIDEQLMAKVALQKRQIDAAAKAHAELEQVLGGLRGHPWVPATVVGKVPLDEAGGRLVVQHENQRRVVDALGDVDVDALRIGDCVYLDKESAVVVRAAAEDAQSIGETAEFDRRLDDRRVIVRHRDEERVVQLAGRLADDELKHGDLVRWDRSLNMVFERIERNDGEHLFMEQTPTDTFDEIGGLDEAIEEVTGHIRLQVKHPDIARRYGIRQAGSVLLEGPPGNGKTKIARAIANWLGALYGDGESFFMNVKPGSLRSKWYGETESHIRRLFKHANDAGERHPDRPIVIFFDEVDSIGSVRGTGGIDDRTMQALYAEIDGMIGRGNVWLLAATNRRDAMDPALLRAGRLGDLIIAVPRPGLDAARQIFGKYLHAEVPYARNGHGDDLMATRDEIIDSAVSLVYSPNGQSTLATLQFRDGSQRDVLGPELISGAMIEKAVEHARVKAGQREAQVGDEGVRSADVTDALMRQLTSAAEGLTPANCRHHLSDLPQDMDVTAVRRPQRSAAPVYAYLDPD